MTLRKSFRCPVCHMGVENNIDSIATEYQGRTFYFCSEQCRDRFSMNVHLYIGARGIPSPKQHGETILKCRVLKLEQPVTDEVAERINRELHEMMGIKEVGINGDRVHIVYDLLEATTRQIEEKLEKIGNKVSSGLGAVLKRAFIHYIEETALDNLEHSSNTHSHH